MQNTLLIGLSRQTVLERQLDVVANNIANVNTAGFKADSSLFEEYLTSGAHEDNFVGRDRRVSFVQDRATLARFCRQVSSEQTKNPLDVSIDGNAFPCGADPGWRALYPRWRPADQSAGSACHLRRAIAVIGQRPARSCSSLTDKDISIVSPDGNITVLEGVNRPYRLGARQASPRQLRGRRRSF